MKPLPARTVRFHQPGCFPAPNVARLARECLHDSLYPDLRAIDCDFTNGVLTLRGRVSSYHMKQVAQEIAARVVAMECLVNQLEVNDSSHLADNQIERGFLRNSAAH